MKNLFILLVATLTFVSCKENNNGYDNRQVVVNDYQPSQVSVTPEVANLGDNLDLQALGELVKNSTSAQDIEDKLNNTGSINNLDLNNDGQVDYIKVTEYGDGNSKGFSFTVDLPNNETQEIATIEVQRGDGGAQMNIHGNQQLYGNQGYYQSHYSLGDLMIMHYLFTPHRPYYSPYRYGYYPSYYHSYRSRPYRNSVTRSTRTTTITRTTRPSTTSSRISSPNANKVSSTVTARAKTLSAPTRSQKSFTTTSAARQRPTTSGFKNKSTSSSPRKSSSSWGSSSSSSRKSSGSSWGSSRSSSRSSGSSSRSSSSRRR